MEVSALLLISVSGFRTQAELSFFSAVTKSYCDKKKIQMNCKGISIELKPSILLTPAMWVTPVWTGTIQGVTKARAWSQPSLHSAHCNPDLDHHTPCAWPLDSAGLPPQPLWCKDALNTGPQQSRFAVVLFLQNNWHEEKIKILTPSDSTKASLAFSL